MTVHIFITLLYKVHIQNLFYVFINVGLLMLKTRILGPPGCAA